jgi:hypothetical protein
MLYREFRFEVIYALFNTVIAPFGKVRFKDFFLADIFCSLVKPFLDCYIITCFFSTDKWKSFQLGENLCFPDDLAICLISLLPFYFRFWQCLNRFYFTKLWFPHTINAGKYLTSMLLLLFTYYKNTYGANKVIFLSFQVFSTLYSLIWDFVMDWGLL